MHARRVQISLLMDNVMLGRQGNAWVSLGRISSGPMQQNRDQEQCVAKCPRSVEDCEMVGPDRFRVNPGRWSPPPDASRREREAQQAGNVFMHGMRIPPAAIPTTINGAIGTMLIAMLPMNIRAPAKANAPHAG